MIGRILNNQRGGAALVTVMAFMALAVPVTASAMSLSSTLSIDSRLKTGQLDCHYAARAGEQYARFLILTDPSYRPTDPEVPTQVTIEVNGCEAKIEVGMSTSMVAGGGMRMEDVEHTFEVDHQIEIKTTVNQDSDQHMLVAYDTLDYPARGLFPSPSGDKTFFLHNDPPGVDTPITLPLPMDETPPTGDTLFNYSTDRDFDPGRFIQRGGHQTDETHLFKYQNWQSEPFDTAFEVNGDIVFDMWVAMNNFDPDWAGMFNICLRDLYEGTYTEIACTTMLVETTVWEEGFTGVSGDESYDVVTTSGGTILYARVAP